MTLDEAIEFAKPNPHGEVTTYKWLVELKEARLEIERLRALNERATLFAQIVQRDSVNGSAYNKASTKWLKDASGGVDKKGARHTSGINQASDARCVLARSVEDCTTDIILTSGFDYLDLIVKRGDEVVKVGLEVSDCQQLIEMLQLVLKHSGVEGETK